MADAYDPMDPPTFDAADETEAYDPSAEYSCQNDGADEDDDYDPSSFDYDGGASDQVKQEQSDQQPPAQQPAQPSKAPQKVAGFIVEESDDEQDEDAPPPSQLNGLAVPQSGQGATAAVTEAQAVSLSSAPQDAAVSSNSRNGSTSVPPVTIASTSASVPLSPNQLSSTQGKTMTPAATPVQASAAATPRPAPNGSSLAPPMSDAERAALEAKWKKHDRVGQLEERIKHDPKGDTDAWVSLIDHYCDKGQHDYAREVYTRFFKIFPTAVAMWLKYLRMERELDEVDKIVLILNQSIMQVPNVDIWAFYMDHVRRALPLVNDSDGKNRGEITQAFELTLTNVGIDPDAGPIWRQYIDFLKDGPGAVGGQSWQDLQKVDILRKAYQRAIKLPHDEIIQMWKEYEKFEMDLNKANGRKHVQEQSPHYVEARKARVQLVQRTEGLNRMALPRLPPHYGCVGEDAFGLQVERWRSWIALERDEDILVYKGTEDEAWRQRVLYVYRQATMSLYFYPPIWFEAATWCFAQGINSLTTEGETFLDGGSIANPESVLLGLMKAERVENSLESGNTDEVLLRNGEKLNAPYEALHTALYGLRNRLQEIEKFVLQSLELTITPPEDGEPEEAEEHNNDDHGENGEIDDDTAEKKPKTREEKIRAHMVQAKEASTARLEQVKKTISYVWVAKMRAFRRVQGQGKPARKGEDEKRIVKGFRGVFAEARPRGALSSDVYVASALMEWNCYKDPSANKIFDRGLKLFPTDEGFILEYIKHLIGLGDVTNARVVFESTIPKIMAASNTTTEQKRQQCRPLITFMHDYESKYGDMPQIAKIEKRMAEIYPDEPEISRFTNRLALPTFDAIHEQLWLSSTQTGHHPSDTNNADSHPFMNIEKPKSPDRSELLLGPNGPYVASPKRPLEDPEVDMPQRKFARAESPLKGAAGMRIQGKSATVPITGNTGAPTAGGGGGGGGGFATKTFTPGGPPPSMPMPLPSGPIPLPPAILKVLGTIPSASSYTGMKFDAIKMVQFMPSVAVEQYRAAYASGQMPRR